MCFKFWASNAVIKCLCFFGSIILALGVTLAVLCNASNHIANLTPGVCMLCKTCIALAGIHVLGCGHFGISMSERSGTDIRGAPAGRKGWVIAHRAARWGRGRRSNGGSLAHHALGRLPLAREVLGVAVRATLTTTLAARLATSRGVRFPKAG